MLRNKRYEKRHTSETKVLLVNKRFELNATKQTLRNKRYEKRHRPEKDVSVALKKRYEKRHISEKD